MSSKEMQTCTHHVPRPPWTTGSLIPLSFGCGITAGVLIWKGGERSKKTQEVEERLREALDAEKGVLKERYGTPVAEDPELLERPPSPREGTPYEEKLPPLPKDDTAPPASPISPTSSRGSGDWERRKRSPLMKNLHIDETMTIPEGQEPTSGTITVTPPLLTKHS